MTDIQIILKLNKEIEDYIENQRDVLVSWEKHMTNINNEPDVVTKYLTLYHDNKKLNETLYKNLINLEEEKNKILGLEK